MRGGYLILVLMNIVLAAYFINSAFGFYPVPAAVLGFEKWIMALAGILLLIGAFRYQNKRMVRYS